MLNGRFTISTNDHNVLIWIDIVDVNRRKKRDRIERKRFDEKCYDVNSVNTKHLMNTIQQYFHMLNEIASILLFVDDSLFLFTIFYS